ncbi:MAG: hypothetical protein ACKOWF_12730 [Chloroflexota bacterium]
MDNSRIQLGAWTRKIEQGTRSRRGALDVHRDLRLDEQQRTRRRDDVSGQPTVVAAAEQAQAQAQAQDARAPRESFWGGLMARLTVRRRAPRLG